MKLVDKVLKLKLRGCISLDIKPKTISSQVFQNRGKIADF